MKLIYTAYYNMQLIFNNTFPVNFIKLVETCLILPICGKVEKKGVFNTCVVFVVLLALTV